MECLAQSVLAGPEEITGRWLKGKRHRFIVASKAGAPMSPLPWDHGGSRKHLLDTITPRCAVSAPIASIYISFIGTIPH